MGMFLGRGPKKTKSSTWATGVSEPSAHTFTKNYEIQTLSLKEAVKNQMQMNNFKREELRELNHCFESEATARKSKEEEVNALQNKIAILQSRVKGLELQYGKEIQKMKENTPGTSTPPGKLPLPHMGTIRMCINTVPQIFHWSHPRAKNSPCDPERK